MTQRVSASAEVARNPQGSAAATAGAYGLGLPQELHTMPHSLRRIPEWYQSNKFQYNARLMVGVAPGLFLLLTVTGKPMFAAIVAGVFLIHFVHYLQHSWISMALSMGHVFLLEAVNVYCMVPIIWRSVLNLPLFGLFHIFIALTGILWMLQDEELLRQDPRFSILLERVLFYLSPSLFIVTSTWIAGILFGKTVLPFIVIAAGFIAFSLFLTPLQSSFAKPNTPSNTGVIQHWVVVLVYGVLLVTVPPLMYAAITYQHTAHFFLMMGLLVCSPVFLLSLLEFQGLVMWLGNWVKLVQYTRMISASFLICLVSSSVLLSEPSSLLPLLLLPILFITLALAFFVDHAPTSVWVFVVGGLLALCYGVAFTQLPWAIRYSSNFLSLPLTMVQLLLWGVALSGAGIMTFWSKATPTLLVVYNAVFILCEFILSSDQVYPHYFSFITGMAAFVTFWRLHSINKLDLNTSVTVMCLHLTKLSLLYPCEHSPSTVTSAVLPLCSTFITSFVLLRLLVFDHTPSLTWSRLLSYSGLLLVGLLLSVDTFVSPLWASLTHTLPSSASLIAFVLGTVATYVSYGCGLLTSQEKPPEFLTSLPPGLAVMAALLALLQPQFSVMELIDSFLLIIGDRVDIPEPVDSYLMVAWTNLLTWLLLFSMVLVLVQLVRPALSIMTPIAVSNLGMLTGFLLSMVLAESLPGSLESLFYAFIMGVGGALCGRAVMGGARRKWIDYILFVCLCVLTPLVFIMEWKAKQPSFLPGLSFLEKYSVPCSLVVATTFLSVAISFRWAMHSSGKDHPYLPVLGNLACVVFFIVSPFLKLHQDTEIIVLFCSLVFLWSQPDGYVRPQTSYVFLAPSLLASIIVLYIMAIFNGLNFLLSTINLAPRIIRAGYLAELIFLVLSVPGQCVFIHSLWTGRYSLPSLSGPIFSISKLLLLLYLLPSSFLPQFSNSLASSILGSVGIFSFSLTVITNSNLNLF